MPVFPILSRFKGRKLREYLEALAQAAEDDRIVPGPGTTITASKGGRVISAQGGGTALVTVRATSTITARSGRTWGTGSGVLTTYSGSGASTDVTGAITLKNPSACSLTSGWEGHARHISGTTYAIIALG